MSALRAIRLAIACGAAPLVLTDGLWAQAAAPTEVSVSDPVRAIFARHDCCGRLADTKIVNVGVVRSGVHRLTVYDLWFVNPESLHGMRHVAFVEEDRFRGSYIISSWVTPYIEGNRVRFRCQDSTVCDASIGEDLVIENGILPPRLWVDGEVNELDNSI